MPQSTVSEHSKTMFLASIHVKAQQIKARMKPYVELINIKGKQAAYDGLGTVEAVEITGRFNKVVFSDIEHTRRKIARRRFAVAIPIDKIDVNTVMQDPESNYVTAVVRAIERVYDRIALEAAFASVYTGEDFDTTVTAATDGVETLDATGGLEYNHMNELRTNFINNDVGTDMPESFFLAITGDEQRALLTDQRVVTYDASNRVYSQTGNASFTAAANSQNLAPNPLANSDYTNKTGRIENGALTNVCGFNIVSFAANGEHPMLDTVDDTVDYRSCLAASTRGIVVGIHDGMEINVEKREDYHQVTQITAVITLGAVRTEGVLVQHLKTPWDATV